MATKKCPNGHQYDSGIYGDNCPFCPSSSHTRVNTTGPTRPTISSYPETFASGDGDKTIPLQEEIGGGGGGHTVIRTIDGTGIGNSYGGRKIVGVLISYSGNPCGEVFKIYEGRNTIGRANTCDIVFKDEKMSGKHLMILFVEAEGVFWAEDQMSSNGTYINGKFSRGMTEIKTNDVIVLGNTKMVFLGVPDF